MLENKTLNIDEALNDFYHHEVSFYIKDKQGAYIGCNQYLLDFSNVSRLSDFVGITDYMTPWEETANHLIDHDNVVMQSESGVKFFEVLKNFKGEYKIFLSHKKPCIQNDKLMGTVGVSVETPAPAVNATSVLSANTCFIDIARKVMLSLTFRQKQVLHLLLQGVSAKEVANCLCISKRTVEHHIELIKEVNEYLTIKDVLLYVRAI
jgi:hypothetical protein